MLQQQLIIECPSCHKPLLIVNKKNEAERACKCPHCGQYLLARFGKASDGDVKGAVPLKGGDTILPQDLERMQSCCVVYNGSCYQLSIGANSIGRKAKTSNADIQIDTDDSYCSREHITITVSRKADGNLKAVLRNCKNKNDTHMIVNNAEPVEVENCDAMVLHHGNRIKMANTEVVFQAVSGNDGETTII